MRGGFVSRGMRLRMRSVSDDDVDLSFWGEELMVVVQMRLYGMS